MAKEWRPFLEDSKAALEEAVRIGKEECLLAELDYSLAEALISLSEVCFKLAEYRPRVHYKYVDYGRLDGERKERSREERQGDELETGKEEEKKESEGGEGDGQDKWEERKGREEALQVLNLRKAAIAYMEASVAAKAAENELLDRYF